MGIVSSFIRQKSPGYYDFIGKVKCNIDGCDCEYTDPSVGFRHVRYPVFQFGQPLMTITGISCIFKMILDQCNRACDELHSQITIKATAKYLCSTFAVPPD